MTRMKQSRAQSQPFWVYRGKHLAQVGTLPLALGFYNIKTLLMYTLTEQKHEKNTHAQSEGLNQRGSPAKSSSFQ